LRGTARSHAFHTELHRFSEQTENVLVVALLLLFGGALVSGLLGDLTVGGALVAVLLVFVVRPISGFVALVRSPLSVAERGAIAFFGVRGFGSVYYVAYACSAAAFAGEGALWSITALAILISIAMHGITATPMMDVVDRTVRRRDRRRAHRVAHSATRS
jgi:NhaP-type Na+/H+ or K+/H+ antiporter